MKKQCIVTFSNTYNQDRALANFEWVVEFPNDSNKKYPKHDGMLAV